MTDFEPVGVFPALPTPMNEDDSINYDATVEHLGYLEEGDVDGYVPSGCTGHAATLGDQGEGMYDEHVEYVRKVAEAADLPVIAGDGINSTHQTIDLATRIEDETDADAHLMISPYQNGPPQDRIVEHYRQIAENTELPIIAYNVPGRTGRNILPETVLEIAGIPGVIGIKEASNDPDQIRRLGSLLQEEGYEDFHLGSGDDPRNPLIYDEGGSFTISVTGNILPEETKRVWEHGYEGDTEEDQVRAETLNNLLMPAHNAMFQTGEKNPISVQYALDQMEAVGADFGTPRAPLDRAPLEGEDVVTADGRETVHNQTEIETVLDHFGLLEDD